MARIARIVAPGIPHHITQRGNRRQDTFFSDDDYLEYLNLMSTWCRKCKVDIWAYCLMPNHVHLVAVPESENALKAAIGEAHRRYTVRINTREGWTGHLWQGRFASFPMDQNYLLSTVRYVLLNPVKAQLAKHPENYPWSSCAALLLGKSDPLADVAPLLSMHDQWRSFLVQEIEENLQVIQKHERTGRPLGDEHFIKMLEKSTGRILTRQKPGPKSLKKSR